MPVSAGLKRLLRIRELEEELSQSALDSAVTAREHFQRKLQLAVQRKQDGRTLWGASASAEQSEGRRIALEEMRMGHRLADFASDRLAEAEKQLSQRRESYLATRTRRRQAETLIEAAQCDDAQLALRRNQQELDEWFRSGAKSIADD
jgi:flagellar export protein FliJ